MIDTTPQKSRSSPDTNQVFAALTDPRRRIALQVLDGEVPVELSELATRVAHREADDNVTEADVERVRLDLYHCHLPKLADAGFIEDPAAGAITLTVDPGDGFPDPSTTPE